ncbi:MAG: uroporphyrinogen decarboxylase [Chlamydiota bacterium]|nr:uroporphyrinogen decarboxylase [Chlamydiota bacterium]
MENTLFLDALAGKNFSGRPPVWLMRQAGRYMPQYRKIREKYQFLEMCKTPEIATEVTLQPVNAFGVDAAILFSDILVIPDALDTGLRFEEGAGPIIDKPVRSSTDIPNLPSHSMKEKLSYVGQAIQLLKKELKIPLIGFAGGPFTVASYMIEGASSKTLRNTKKWMLRDPDSFHRLLRKLTNDTIEYIEMQIDAGVDAIQIFDSWAHVLSHRHFKEFSLTYLKSIANAVKAKDCPSILFCRGSSVFAPQLAEAQPSCIGIDWNADLATVRKIIPNDIALQGNLDPDILYAPKESLVKEVNSTLFTMQHSPNHIFNLGHGIAPDVSPDAVKTLVDTIKNYVP